MDNPTQESAVLNLEQAAALYAATPEEKREEAQPEAQNTPESEETQKVEEPTESQDVEADEGAQKVTIEVDGKTVELTKQELADAYKNGLRQSDYTRKTMEVSEQRKAADAEIAQARQERDTYSNNLRNMQAVLEASLTEQQNINWQQLLETDPVEYLRQQHLYQQRQAAYQQNMQEQFKINAIVDQENQQAALAYKQDQTRQLLERIPEWKDEAKAKASTESLRNYMRNEGASDGQIDSLSHHLLIVWADKAMRYDAIMKKADAATKKVAAAPQKVVKPGVAGTSHDQRTAAWQKFGKSGSIRDAAALYSQLKNS